MHNEHLELNQGFEGDPGTPAYEQPRGVYHSQGIALRRVAALFFSLDCKPNCMEPSEHGHAPYERAVSLAQWASIGQRTTLTSKAGRERAASALAAPPPETESAHGGASSCAHA